MGGFAPRLQDGESVLPERRSPRRFDGDFVSLQEPRRAGADPGSLLVIVYLNQDMIEVITLSRTPAPFSMTTPWLSVWP